MVWMMSSISWPGWLGSPCANASASWTRREISGISSTLAFVAATVNSPTNRCSMAWPLRARWLLADHHDVRVRAVAQEAGHRGLREHQQIVGTGQLREHVGAQPEHAEAAGRVDRRLAVAHRAALIAQQDEVPVGEPAQQRGDVAAVVARGSARRGRRPARSPGRPGWRSAPPSRRPPGARRRARWAAASAASATVLASTDGDSATWIHVSSTPSRGASGSAAGRISTQLDPTGRGAPGTPGS